MKNSYGNSGRGKQPILEISEVTMEFSEKLRDFSIKKKPRTMKAVDNLTLTIYKGETLGLVGESGCGKSTTGKMIVRLLEPTLGKISYEGQNIFDPSYQKMASYHQKVQIIFQDPYSSLDPRFTIGRTIMEPMKIWGVGTEEERRRRALEILEIVGLKEEHFDRYPFEFSGGQRQRIGVARALMMNPDLIVCDEPVSALDVSIQAQVLNLLQDIQNEFNLTYLFISHNLSVIKHFCDRVCVMYMGQLVESAPNEELFSNPKHPYTKALLAAIPEPDPTIRPTSVGIMGEIPSPFDMPIGCKFQGRCPYVGDICKQEMPQYYAENDTHIVKCHFKNLF